MEIIFIITIVFGFSVLYIYIYTILLYIIILKFPPRFQFLAHRKMSVENNKDLQDCPEIPKIFENFRDF